MSQGADERRGAGGGGDGDFEAALRAALAADADARRDTMWSLIADSMRGQSKPLAGLTLAIQLALMVGAVLCVVSFFGASSTRDQIMYATGFIVAMNTVGLIKAWFWMTIHRNRTLREVKRLELQVASLADGLTARA